MSVCIYLEKNSLVIVAIATTATGNAGAVTSGTGTAWAVTVQAVTA